MPQSRRPSPSRASQRPKSPPRQKPAEPPEPSPPESLEEEAPRVPPAEGASSTVSSAGSFVSDSGPEFDPKQAPEAPPVEVEEPPPGFLEEWDEGRVRELLELQGEVTHAVFNGGPLDDETWLHTERDLRAIAPPLTRILNRYDPTRAAAVMGDEALLIASVGRYGVRNYTKRRRYLAAQQDQQPAPVTGAPAPEGTGPEHDEQWQRTQGADMRVEPPALIPKGGRR